MEINFEKRINSAFLCLALKRHCTTLEWLYRSSENEILQLYDEAYRIEETAKFLANHGSGEANKVLLDAIYEALKLQNAQLAEKKARINDTACHRALKEFSRYHSEKYVKTLPAFAIITKAKVEADKAFLEAVNAKKEAEEKFNAANKKLDKLLSSLSE